MEFLLPDCLELGHQSVAAFRFKLEHLLFLGLESAGFQTCTIVSTDFQALGLKL